MRRQWSKVMRAWRPELKDKPSVSSVPFRKNYERLLLAFENHLSEGAPSHIIKPDTKPRRGNAQVGTQ